MEKGKDNYRKVIELLKSSSPQPGHPDLLEEKIMERIRMKIEAEAISRSVPVLLFGWTRIGWVRRVLSAAAFALILFLAYQQSIIIKQISILNQQLIPVNMAHPASGTSGSMGLLLYRLSAVRDLGFSRDISDDRINQLIETVDLMNERYWELIRMIDEDPELKKIIEKKLEEKLDEELSEKVKL